MYMVPNIIQTHTQTDILIWDNSDTGGYGKKLRKDNCRKDIKFSLPQRCIEVWNGLDKRVTEARTINKYKEMLDSHRYGEGTA